MYNGLHVHYTSNLGEHIKQHIKEKDNFHINHPDTHWESQIEHGEKIGLGSSEYELIEIITLYIVAKIIIIDNTIFNVFLQNFTTKTIAINNNPKIPIINYLPTNYSYNEHVVHYTFFYS